MRSLLFVGVVLGCASVAGAQTRSTAPAPTSTGAALRLVDERIAANDSLGALAVLDSALAKDERNGPLLNRYGHIAWGMSHAEQGPVMRPLMVRLRTRADSAFRYAVVFAPDSAQYYMDLGRYAMQINLVGVRIRAKGTFEDGLKVARTLKRDSLAADLQDQVGMFAWRDYDIVNHRAVEKSADQYASTPTPVAPTLLTYQSVLPGATVGDPNSSAPSRAQATPGTQFRSFYAAYYRERLSLVTPITGEAPFATALNHFRDAYALDSSNARVRRHLFMAYADHESWRDLLSITDRALKADNDDVDSWLARGIATSSLEDYEAAAAAFDRALRRMTPAERASFTDVRRMLRPYTINNKGERYSDTLRWTDLSAAERRRQETLFWNLADPRPSTRVNEGMVEYFARIAYANLRFGDEDRSIRGADSPRGDTWIRYGKPDFLYSVVREEGITNVIWIYQRLQLAFVFDLRAAFGNARWAFDEGPAMDSIHAEHPIGWDNLPLARRTWPMRMRVARFRSSADSMDAVVTATVPVRSFLGGVELKGPMPIAVQLDVHDPAARIVGRELRTVNVNSDSLPVGLNGAWVRRLGRGPNVVRVDAEQRDVRRSASANVDAIVDSSSGFGISDLLLGTNPTVMAGKSPVRWTDVSIAPTTGVFPWSQSVGVVWESYDLTPHEGSVRYKVHVNLQRTFKSNVVGFIARIAAYSRNVVQRDGSATGSVSVDYEQVRAAAPTIADFLSINLNGSVTGTYRLTIEIEDLVAKRTVSRSTTLELTKD